MSRERDPDALAVEERIRTRRALQDAGHTYTCAVAIIYVGSPCECGVDEPDDEDELTPSGGPLDE